MAFGDLPIRRKLLILTLTSSVTAVVLAMGGFLAWGAVQTLAEIRTDVQTQANLLGETMSAALTFNDPKVAIENLGALKQRPRIVRACVYTNKDDFFADYLRTEGETCPSRPPARRGFSWSTLETTAPVVYQGETLGTILLERDLIDVYDGLRIGGLTALGLLLVAVAAAFVIAARIQRSITGPLLQLAGTARTISTGRDYSLRAGPASNDEVGVVVRAFNDMLDRIGERTTALSQINVELEREVDERRRVEVERVAALERERDANRLKDEFLATLSHELRTPLNAVLGWARVLRTANVDASTQGRALESIERNARAQARLIEDILEVSRIVTGKLRLQVRDADLAAIIDSAVEIVQPAAAAKRLKLTVQIEARPAMTTGDPDRLQQVIWNLVSNAVKFTPTDGEVTVRLEQSDGYRLTVRDTGPGIDPKFLPFVFEPFRQADGTASREHGGLGLGLAIAKQLVELHGGTVEARSEGRGQGATFAVFLPSVTGASVQRVLQSITPRAPATVDANLLRGIHVLVIDDEDDARALMETALRQYGARVSLATNAAEALATIVRDRPDVVLSDVGMPHEDGFTMIRRLRAQPVEAGGLTPAIAITAYASLNDRLAAEAAGYQAHVAKPFEPSFVAALVARLARTGDLASLEHRKQP
jgi:signal transduction histidine kinase/ActR/RegA family two-component response regulator